MIVVSDTTPLNYLILVEAISILHALFGRVYAPPAVIRELSDPRSPELVRRWASSPPDWLIVQAPTSLDPSLKLGPGEREAILLAHELSADFILIDERKGCKVATARGLKVVSTLAILEEAGARKLLGVRNRHRTAGQGDVLLHHRRSARRLQATSQRTAHNRRGRRIGPASITPR
jgi:predicted nucleic acid-binding protein